GLRHRGRLHLPLGDRVQGPSPWRLREHADLRCDPAPWPGLRLAKGRAHMAMNPSDPADGGDQPAAGLPEAVPMGSDQPGNVPAVLAPERRDDMAPIVVPNTHRQPANPAPDDVGAPSHITALREVG